MKYFLHDSSSFDDEKISELFINFGYEGLGLFYTILEKLARQEKPIKTSVLKHQLKVGKKLQKCWDFMEGLELICSNNGETFNKQLINYSEKYKIKSEKNAKRISDWRDKQTVTEDVTHSESVRNASKVKVYKGNVSKEKESNINTKSVSVADTPTPSENIESEERGLEDSEKKGKEKSSAKKESPGLVRAKTSYQNAGCTFSTAFKNIWLSLCESPKWKNKPQSAIDSNLVKLMEYEEVFAISLCEYSIRGNYQGVVYDNTDEKYQKYLSSKNGISTNTRFQSPAERKQSRDNLGALADRILAGASRNPLRPSGLPPSKNITSYGKL